jgi:hypothetical protein
MSKTFPCPHCGCQIFLVNNIVCQNCFAEMLAYGVAQVEFKVALNNSQDFYTGISSRTAETAKTSFVASPLLEARLCSNEVFAVYPAAGMLKNKPLLVLCNSDAAELETIPQRHPQIDRPFSRFFIKGMTYSALGNSLVYALIQPPVWQLFGSLFLFAGLYAFYSRKEIATGTARKEGLKKQRQLQSQLIEELVPHDPN